MADLSRVVHLVLFGAVVVTCLLVAGAAYQMIGLLVDRRRFPAPGRLVDVDTHRLHLVDMGEGHPVVILESGMVASSLSWTLVQSEVARFARVCSYDRAGLGWSDRGPRPRTIRQITDELHTMLTRAGVSPPYVLVGHSFGGLVMQCYAAAHQSDVAAIILIDPLDPREWCPLDRTHARRLNRGVKLSRFGAMLARVGIVRACLTMLSAGSTGFPRAVVRLLGADAANVTSRLAGEVSKLPVERWPELRARWCDPKSLHGMADHLNALPESAGHGSSAKIPPHVPLVVLCPESVHEDHSGDGLPNERHIRIPGSGHWIQFDRPDLVVNAIRDAVDLVRRDRLPYGA